MWSASGVFHPARVSAEDASGRTYSVTIPVGTVAKMTVNASGLGLRESEGRALPGGSARVDVQIQEGEAAAGRTERFTVTP